MAPVPPLTDVEPFIEHLPLIERVVSFVARRHYLTRDEADDFSSHVKVKLFDDDCAIVRKCKDPHNLRTYLTVVISRLLLDYRVQLWGKWRPSAEAKRQGPVAVLLDRLMSRDGFTFEEAFEVMVTNHRIALPRNELERMAAALPVRVKRRFQSEDVLAATPSADPSPEQQVAEHERQTAAERVSRALARVVAQLDEQDRLLLVLHFKDGYKISEIAVLLRLDQKPLYRRLERLLGQLRKALAEEGCDARAIAELLK